MSSTARCHRAGARVSARSASWTPRLVAAHPERGWSLLCNGAIVFDGTGELLPDGRGVLPHRPDHHHRPAIAA
jgi:hypothetical protein